MPMSKAHIKATAKYNAKTYKNITFRVYQGQEQQITEYAKSKGLSLNGYINALIAQDMGEKLTKPNREEPPTEQESE